MKTGTGRLAHLCVTNSVLIEGAGFGDHPHVNALLDDPSNFCVHLYPAKESIDISTFAPPSDRRLVIFIIDTKWSVAKTVLNRTPRLKALPQIRFTPARPSTIQIRQQPRPECLSTIEAVHFVLESLYPGRAEHAGLLEAFNKMVRRQLTFESTPTRRHKK